MQTTKKQKSKNKFGQYFTPEIVADFMIDLAEINHASKILEPSCGEGIFLSLLKKKGFSDLTAYEIDTDLVRAFEFVRYESFVSAVIEEKFDLIIGNPPYIRWANLEDELKRELLRNPIWNHYFNSLCDYLYIFILKSITLLNENGQLIFICPEYWMNTTHSLTLRNYMVAQGYFEEIFHFNETPIFDKITVSVVIFKFVKSKKKKENITVSKFYANQKLTSATLEKIKMKESLKEVEYLTIPQFRANERWILADETVKKELKNFENHCQKPSYLKSLSLFENESVNQFHTIGEFCDIGNGLVSGLDKAFQLNGHILNEQEEKSLLKVVKAKNLKPFYYADITRYIFLEDGLKESELKNTFPHFFEHLQVYKLDLEKRFQYQRQINYWEWVFLRNFNLFNRPEPRIFVPCKERVSNKNHFRFALAQAGVFPTQDVTAIFRKPETKESIAYILAFLNNIRVFDWLKCNGIVKGNIVEFSEKPIASIPFKAIDWTNEMEIKLHDRITDTTQRLIKEKNEMLSEEINQLFDNLFYK